MLSKKTELREFFLSLTNNERVSFAKSCGTTTGQIEQIYRGYRSCSETLAIEIDKNSNGVVSCDTLCPNTDFDYLRQQPKVEEA